MKKIAFIIISFLSISCYKNDIEALNKQVVQLQYKLDSLSNALTVNTTILQKRADSLSAALTVTNSKISQTSLSITAAIKTSDSISTQLKAINTQIATLNGQLTTANANVTSISAQITTLNQQYSDLLTKYNSLLTLINMFPPYSLYTNLIAYYPFTGNAKDKGGIGLDGTVIGSVLTTDRFGSLNSAYSFNTNQYINIQQTNDKNVYPMSISLWASFDSLNNNSGSLFKKYAPAMWDGFALLPSTGALVNTGYVYPLYLTGQGIPNGLIGGYGLPETSFVISKISTSKWVQITMTVDSTVGKLYLNGNMVDSLNWRTKAMPSSNNLTWMIGGSYQGENWFKGKIDDVGVWQRALTISEVQYLYLNKFIQ